MRSMHFACMVLLLISGGVQAHHSRANFVVNQPITVEVTVKTYQFKSPHIYIEGESVGKNGEPVPYLLEGPSPPQLLQLGWDKNTFQPGDKIRVTGDPDRDPSRRYLLFKFIERDDGTPFYTTRKDFLDAQSEEDKKRLAPVIVPTHDFTGTWERVLDAINPTLAGTFDPPKDYPLTEKGQALIEKFNFDESPASSCIPLGNPRGLTYAYGLQIRREEGKIIFDKELRNDPRVVHMDMETHPDIQERGPWGHAIGWMDGDVLVVDSVGFWEEKWGLATGIDSGLKKQVVERWTQSDDGLSLEVDITLIDPEYLTQPVTTHHKFRKTEDRELSRELCDPEQARLFELGHSQQYTE